jgi:hypothetical protein
MQALTDFSRMHLHQMSVKVQNMYRMSTRLPSW